MFTRAEAAFCVDMAVVDWMHLRGGKNVWCLCIIITFIITYSLCYCARSIVVSGWKWYRYSTSLNVSPVHIRRRSLYFPRGQPSGIMTLPKRHATT